MSPTTQPKHLGPYELLEMLGEGMAGLTYRARDTRLGRLVALKLLRPAVAARGNFRTRFLREGRALAQISHPNVVTIHDCDEREGYSYLVMELVEGATLGCLIAQHASRLPVGWALQLTRGVLSGLDAAHARQILHRDVKPANVLLTSDLTPKVADFGLAKLMGEDTITRTGTTLGTPSYMPPEQCAVGRFRVTPASDLFSVGVILYELLTGQLPFVGRDLIELFDAKTAGSFAPLRSLRPDVPPEFEACLQHLLRPDQADRPQSVSQALELLSVLGVPELSPLSAPSLRPSSASPITHTAASPPYVTLAAQGDEASTILGEPRPGPMIQGSPCRLRLEFGGLCSPPVTIRLGQSVVVGRGKDCDLRLDDKRLSGRHCELTLTVGGEVAVRDLGSTSGTYLNDQVIQEGVLRAGDRLELGSRTYSVVLEPLK
jgi:serine/threonine protein kinase